MPFIENENSKNMFKKSSDPMIANLTQYLNAKTEEW